MNKKIKIILKKDYLNIGKKNTIVNASRGYIFNYLIPQGIAEIATKNKIKHLNMFISIKEREVKKNLIKVENLYNNLLLMKKITLRKKIGENNLIFGSISEKEIINEIKKYTNINLDKKYIKIPEIKKIGIFSVEINLLHKKSFNLQLNIHPANI